MAFINLTVTEYLTRVFWVTPPGEEHTLVFLSDVFADQVLTCPHIQVTDSVMFLHLKQVKNAPQLM